MQKHPKDPGKLSDAPSLLTISEKIHLVLTKEDLPGDSCLLASHFMDWRRTLSAQDGQSNFSLELNGIGAENNVPVGILEVKLSLIPKISKVWHWSSVGLLVMILLCFLGYDSS